MFILKQYPPPPLRQLTIIDYFSFKEIFFSIKSYSSISFSTLSLTQKGGIHVLI